MSEELTPEQQREREADDLLSRILYIADRVWEKPSDRVAQIAALFASKASAS